VSVPSPSPHRVAVTTSVRPDDDLQTRAAGVAQELGFPYHPRRNVNVTRALAEAGADRLLIVSHERLTLRDAAGVEFFYHPNMALLRGLNVLRGWRDVYVDAARLEAGQSVLDCTVGFAAEAMVASLIVGPEGKVVGLESVPELAAVIRDGVRRFAINAKLRAALARVEIVTADYRDYLAASPERSFDIVYFDPFFAERLYGSEHTLDPLHAFGNPSPLDPAAVLRAMAVARRRVIVKHSKLDELPAEVEQLVTETITARKSKTVYRVVDLRERT
jgi:16S rRNA G966 N2-methylase RsmD